MRTPLLQPLHAARHQRGTPWRTALLAIAALTATFAFAGLAFTPTPGLAANVALDQCNGLNGGPTGATTEIRCTVTIVNTVDGVTTSSTTTVSRQCSNEPCTGGGNGTFTSSSSDLVTDIRQCNASGNDAGIPVVCSVDITNVITAGSPGADPITAATVNQCVGSGTGGGGSMVCTPLQSTPGATVTQCNGSGDGGGTAITCDVEASSTVSPRIPITVDQCNGSARKGGNLLTCDTAIRTSIVQPASAPAPAPTASATSSPSATPSASPSAAPSASPSAGPSTSPSATPTTAAPTDEPTPVPAAPTVEPAPAPASDSGVGLNAEPAGPAAPAGAPGPDASTGTSTGAPSGSTSQTTSQITRVPSGGVSAGGGSTAGQRSPALLGLSGLLLLAAFGNAGSRRSMCRARHLRLQP